MGSIMSSPKVGPTKEEKEPLNKKTWADVVKSSS